MKNILRLENVTMQFGGVVAVNNLSMEVNEGEIVSLIGPNGAGKTTVFNVITGVYEATNGRIDFEDNLLITNYPKGKMKKLYAGENKGMYKSSVVKTPDKITKLVKGFFIICDARNSCKILTTVKCLSVNGINNCVFINCI